MSRRWVGEFSQGPVAHFAILPGRAWIAISDFPAFLRLAQVLNNILHIPPTRKWQG